MSSMVGSDRREDIVARLDLQHHNEPGAEPSTGAQVRPANRSWRKEGGARELLEFRQLDLRHPCARRWRHRSRRRASPAAAKLITRCSLRHITDPLRRRAHRMPLLPEWNRRRNARALLPAKAISTPVTSRCRYVNERIWPCHPVAATIALRSTFCAESAGGDGL